MAIIISGRTIYGPRGTFRPMVGMYTAEEVDDLVNNQNYIPVANVDEWNDMAPSATVTMGSGSDWEGVYTTGNDKKYIQINNLDFTSGFQAITVVDGFVFDGSELNLHNFSRNLFGATFPSGAWARNMRTYTNIVNPGASSQTSDNLIARNNGGLLSNIHFSGSISNRSSNISAKGVISDGQFSTGVMRDIYVYASCSFAEAGSGLLVGLGRGTFENITITGSIHSSELGAVGGAFGAFADVVTIRNLTADVFVSGSTDIGGLVGGGTNTASGSLIENVAITGDVHASDTGNAVIGGIFGESRQDMLVRNTYFSGSVTSNGNYVGGFGGIQYFGDSKFVNCYSVATITSPGNNKNGFLSDFSTPEISNSYWDITVFTESVGLGEGKTTSELKTPTSSSGIYSEWTTPPWDFGGTNDYPTLEAV